MSVKSSTPARKVTPARTLASAVKALIARDTLRAAVSEGRTRLADATRALAESASLARRARNAARPLTLGASALRAASTLAGVALADGVTVPLTGPQVSALAGKYDSFKALAGPVRVNVTTREDGTLWGTVVNRAAGDALAAAERAHVVAERAAERAQSTLAATIARRDAATLAARERLATLSPAERREVTARAGETAGE